MKNRMLLTGATGFLGQAMLARAQVQGRPVTAAVRAPPQLQLTPADRQVALGPFDASTSWRSALEDVDVVVHAAARAHVMHDSAHDPLALYLQSNTDATLRLAEESAAAGVRRFIFISTVKVHGESTAPGAAFSESDSPQPADPYAVSKWRAEQGLKEIAARTGLEVVCVRPPLIYGPGVRANFRALALAIRRGVPLPLASVHNRRSLVGLENLVDFLMLCVDHPNAGGLTFLVSDGLDLSTPELARRLAAAMGKRARLLPLPVPLLLQAASLVGRRATAQRLCESLRVDIGLATRVLDWRPPVSVDAGLAATVARL